MHVFMLLNIYAKLLATLFVCTKYHGMVLLRIWFFQRGENWTSGNSLVKEMKNKVKIKKKKALWHNTFEKPHWTLHYFKAIKSPASASI